MRAPRLIRASSNPDPATLAQIMSSPVVGVSPIASVPRIMGLLRMTGHNGFPVLAPPEGLDSHHGDGSLVVGADGRPQHGRNGRKPRAPRRLLGMILRSQLSVLLERGAFCDAEGALRSGLASSLCSAKLCCLHASGNALPPLANGHRWLPKTQNRP